MKDLKDKFNTKKFKNGSYSAGIIVAAIAVVVVLNLVVNSLPATITKIDLSYNQMYSLTDTTKEFLKILNDDVTIYLLAETGKESQDMMEMLEKYRALSSKITVETVDPVLHPTFTSTYTEEALADGSMIVVSDKRSKVIHQSDLFETTMNYQTYQMEVTGFDGEGLITSALDYVTTDTLPIVYTLDGHNGMTLSQTLSALIEKANIEIRSVNLLTEEAIPDDASALMINRLQTDLSEDEAKKIIKYLEQGGSMWAAVDYTGVSMPNFDSVLEYYGVRIDGGVAIETDSNYYYPGLPSYLLPKKNQHSITQSLIEKGYLVLFPLAQNISVLDSARSTITVEPLLVTTEKGFLRTAQNAESESFAMIEGDIEGPLTVAAAISENYNGVESKIVLFTSASILDDTINAQVNGANYELVTNGLGWLSSLSSSIAIDAKTYRVSILQLTGADVNMWTIVLVVGIPVVILACGFVVWFVRRRR